MKHLRSLPRSQKSATGRFHDQPINSLHVCLRLICVFRPIGLPGNAIKFCINFSVFCSCSMPLHCPRFIYPIITPKSKLGKYINFSSSSSLAFQSAVVSICTIHTNIKILHFPTLCIYVFLKILKKILLFT